MIQLTPLDKTVAGQELIQMGIEEGMLKGLEKGIKKGIEKGIKKGIEKGIEKGRMQGVEKGKFVGKIHFAQRLLRRPVTPEKKLLAQSPKELRAVLKKLEADLKKPPF